MLCPECATENRPGRKFCSQCGTALAQSCPSCGAPNDPADRFCGECGTDLAGGTPAVGQRPQARPEPAAERRLVSVLFADLVGFTTLSENRDAEEVRDLLTRYFDTARRIIDRYGGTIEKFIGDAVMAVWGTPVAQEDDAERAVRAALDLVGAITTLGEQVGSSELRMRAGVATGEAAVTVGAEGQGMVAGDLVNTASRLQSVAPPGAVLVGDPTRRASEASIAYEPAGSHELKGKAEPVELWRALRVVASRLGFLRASGLEAPFVGRGREIRRVKEMFHMCEEEKRAHLLSVVGVGGIGKSRLSNEFERYIDGLADTVWWHRGRCLSYGEGVTYWALAEMVRMRARIAEEEDPTSALAKLQAVVQEFVPDLEERRWMEPRLAHLLSLEERSARDREELFSAWRMFFERLAQQNPIVMVFEDLHWADASLLDFIEYLLEWSRNHPVFIVTLARPELAERRSDWGAGKRNFTSMFLEPLSSEAMDELLDGLIPGMPTDLKARIGDRAEGVPLYAVETVRMLIDRGMLTKAGDRYETSGAIESLDVPETLHALIAARLDGLRQDERRVIQDASVLGKSFTKPAVAALTGMSEPDVEPVLAGLVRKEVLGLQADPRSPERGQYGFLQALVQKVAYETLSRKERKGLHLAVAEYLDTTWGSEDEEIVEVVASHFVDAYVNDPDGPDAADIKTKACNKLVGAGERAESLAASAEAQRYYEKAAELAEDPILRARLLAKAGEMGEAAGASHRAEDLLLRAIELFEEHDLVTEAARASGRLAMVVWSMGRIDEALERVEGSFEVLAKQEPDEVFALLAAELATLLYFRGGELDEAAERIELALRLSEELWLPHVLSRALNTKSLLLLRRGRRGEGQALLEYAVKLAVENDLIDPALLGYLNLTSILGNRDRADEALECAERGLALARRVGNHYWEWGLLANKGYPLFRRGDWDEAVALLDEVPDIEETPSARFAYGALCCPLPLIAFHRGQPDEIKLAITRIEPGLDRAEVQELAMHAFARALLAHAEGRFEDALKLAEEAASTREKLGIDFEFVIEGYVELFQAAFDAGRVDKVRELLEIFDSFVPSELTPYLRAHAARARARLAAAQGDHNDAEALFEEAAGTFRDGNNPFPLAETLTMHGEWLEGRSRSAEAAPLFEEADGVFRRLQASPWLERLARTQWGSRASPDRVESA
jgi:class 3 adenylate cyclase/tetratricopeptide (TPR) repeat protein